MLGWKEPRPGAAVSPRQGWTHEVLLPHGPCCTSGLCSSTATSSAPSHLPQALAAACPRNSTYLNWCSLELRILEEKRSASFSRLREYSSSISAFLRKNSCRSCSSCRRDSDCCSRHFSCSTSCVRISAGTRHSTNNISCRQGQGVPPCAEPAAQLCRGSLLALR